MDLTKLPFNAHLGIHVSEEPDQLLALPFAESLLNHLGTIHAGAIYTLAEASSAEFLMRHRGGDASVGGVVRKATSKYSKPAATDLYASSDGEPEAIAAAVQAVMVKGRALVTIPVAVHAATGETIGRFTFDWFLAKSSSS